MNISLIKPAHKKSGQIVLAALIICCIGCGGKHESRIQGIATLDGMALQRGLIAFHPQQGGAIGYGVIRKDGSYEVMTGREAGLRAGDYDVTVVATEFPTEKWTGSGPPPPGRQLTPASIGSRKTTHLHYTVEPGNNEIHLELESQD